MIVIAMLLFATACTSDELPGSAVNGEPSRTPVAGSTPVISPPSAGERASVSPAEGPPGTLVRVEGDGFVDPLWQALNEWDEPGGHREFFGLIRPSGDGDACELIVDDEYVSSSVSESGHLVAEFRIGSSGNCFQEDRTATTKPGVYQIHLVCHPCYVGTFTVTE